MHGSQGKNIQCAEPSTPVEIIGLRAVPEAGVELLVVDSEERAKQVVEERSKRDASLALRRHVESGASSSSLVETSTSDIGMLSTEDLAKKGPKQGVPNFYLSLSSFVFLSCCKCFMQAVDVGLHRLISEFDLILLFVSCSVVLFGYKSI